MTCPRPRNRRLRRIGFTLVEMLVVILILAILIALLLPGIMSAVRRTRAAAVSAEIGNLAAALADFKSRYGDYPPSRMLLMENGAFDTTGTTTAPPGGWYTINGSTPAISATDITYAQLAQCSVRYLRKFFPRVQFSTTSTQPTVISNTFFYDFNGNNNPDAQPIYLEGHECLTFFLGGIPNHTGGIVSMSGFAKSPTNPFQNATVAANRQAPQFEFRSDRLVDDDGDGIPGYIDSLGTGADARYYAYFSSYGGGSYDPNDVNFLLDVNDNTQTPIARVFRVNYTVASPGASFPTVNGQTNWVVSWAPNPYSNSLPVIAGNLTPTVFQNPETFQIISPGTDRDYGVGGQYVANVTGDRLPIADATAAYHTSPTACSLDAGIRQRERDNLTNFATANLD